MSARRSIRRRGARRCSPISRMRRAQTPGRRLDLDLLRRRHALADAAGDGRRADRRRRSALGLRAGHRDHARGQSLLGRGGALRRSRRAPASTGSRSACRRSTTRRCASSAAPMMSREGLAALDTAQAAFARVSFDLIYALPGQSEAAWAPSSTARWPSAPAISRSTSSPSSPARASRRSPPRASWSRPIPITAPRSTS